MLGRWKTGARWLFGSIRGRILLLLLVTVVPLVGERVNGLEIGRQDRLRLTSYQLLDLANQGVQREAQMLSATNALLRTIAAAAPAVADPTRQECRQLLENIGNPLPSIYALQVATVQGRVMCSTRPEIVGLDVSDRNYFRETVRTAAPAVSDVLIGRATSSPTVVATLPMLAPDGTVNSVLFAALRLDWMEALLAERAAHSDIVAFIVNRAGTIVARHPNPEIWRGRNFGDNNLIRDFQRGARSFAGADLDGERRIFASATLNDSESLLVVGLRENDVLSSVNRQVYVAYGILAFVTLLVLLASWFGGDRFIVRPIQAMVGMASSVGHGDYEASRTRMRVPLEFRPLLTAIRSMAARLRDRETAMKRTNEHLGRLAQVDALTGLGNRGSFDAHLFSEHASAHVSKEPLALLLIDVDHFKAFNDLYGHVAGDACLRAVAQAIAGAVRDCDFAARYGGEEFAVLGRGMTPEAALAVAERLSMAVRTLAVPHERSPHRLVTISIGIASTVPQEDELPERLVEEADVALYAAKKQGRDRIGTSADTLALAG